MRKFAGKITKVQCKSHCESRKDDDIWKQNSVEGYHDGSQVQALVQLNMISFFKNLKR